MSIIVMAGGGAKRLNGVCKPMLEVGGVTLLSRIARQVRAAWCRTPLVITDREEIIDAGFRVAPSVPGWTVQGLTGIRHLWDDYTVILLGDVLYSKDAIYRIHGNRSKLVWFGNRYEIFALSFDRSVWDSILAAAEKVQWPGKLRTLYNVYHNLPDKFDMNPKMGRDHWMWIIDSTTDIDNEEQYESAVNCRRWANPDADIWRNPLC